MSAAVKARLQKIFKDAEELLLEERSDDRRFFFMRPSGFPYCGLKKLLEAPAFFNDTRTSSLASSYFTSVGTATHSVFQKFIGRLGHIIGDWKCPRCKNVKKFTTFCMCEECRLPRHYDELELTYRNTVVGHTDALVRLDPEKGKKSKHYVLDYKTSAFYKTSRSPQRHFPIRSNVQQIKMYVVLLEEMYGVAIDGYVLTYLGRDLPLGKRGQYFVVVTMTDKEKRKCKKQLDRWVKVHHRVLRAKKPEHVEYIKKNKLCASMQDYKDNYHQYEGCSISPFCFDEKKLTALIEKRLKKKWYPIIDQAPDKIRRTLEKEQT